MTVTKIGEKVLVEEITLNLTEETIERGNKVKIKTTFQPSNTTNKKLKYKSSNEEVVKVSEKGEIEAVGIGEGIITVTSEENNNVTKEIKITVIAPEYATRVTIEKEDKELNVGETLQLTGVLEPNDVTSKVLIWTSSNTEIASVSDAGLVTGKKAGTTTITATTQNNVSATIEIEVLKTSYANGTAIYYNPVSGEICEESEAVSTTGTKTGCMKWYVFNDSKDATTVNVILDHNTTAKLTWNSSKNVAYESSNLKSEVDKLVSESKWVVTPRLISAEEIAKITENSGWTNTSSWYYLDSNSTTQTAKSKGASKYAWLFDNTYGCTSYGCNIGDGSVSNLYGYWTSTPNGTAGTSSFVWGVTRDGKLYNNFSSYNYYGVRPVISISKSILS